MPSRIDDQVTQLILHRDETGESKRFAFVTFADKESTSACLEKLDGLEVAGKALAVRYRHGGAIDSGLYPK